MDSGETGNGGRFGESAGPAQGMKVGWEFPGRKDGCKKEGGGVRVRRKYSEFSTLISRSRTKVFRTKF